MLSQRILTGVALAIAALAALLWLPAEPLAGLLGAVSLLALWEWSNLAGVERLSLRLGYCAAGGFLLWLGAGWAGLDGSVHAAAMASVLTLTATGWVLGALAVKTYPHSAAWWGRREWRALIGAMAVLPTWWALIYLLHLPQGRGLIIFVIALVAAADVGAYAVGRRFGRRKLAPRVSPGKSFEGFWGGLGCVLLFALAVWLLAWHDRIDVIAMAAIAIATGLASVIGDLVESMVKRHRGIKDSGRILPGHGGMLDRLDSLCAAVPIFALGLLLAGWQ